MYEVVETVLPEAGWRARGEAHTARVDGWTAGWRARRAHGERHPVDDFLFTYYPYRPSMLRRWHPGATVALAGDAEHYLPHGYTRTSVDGVAATALSGDRLARSLPTARAVLALQRAVLDRPNRFGCFGMHEWAMVYGQGPGEVRHAAWPLRLAPAEIAAVVDATGLRCTHFDAYRFFTPAAVPGNEQVLTRATQVRTEQGGCLHANMDLYKWSAKLAEVVGSDLMADAFELARDIRDLDMRAAPYDLGDLGYQPVPVETAAGRTQYADEQRELAVRAELLRRRLVDSLTHILSRVDG